MKVLITGSSGLLGRTLSSRLVAKKIHVIGLDLREEPGQDPGEYFRYYKCCITDRARLESIFSTERPTNVAHFACTFNSVRNPRSEFDIDVGGARNILEISNNTPSVRQLVFSSSAAAYGGHEDNAPWLKESDPLRPGRFPYGFNKELIEKMLFESPVREDLHIASLRICSVVGPLYSRPGSVVSLLIKSPFLPKFFKETKLQFIHTDDFLSLAEQVLEDQEIQGVFNVAPDNYTILKEITPGKKFVPLPLGMIKGVLWMLWGLHILKIKPVSLNNSVYPILLDPAKIIGRYGYRFKYTSKEAFEDTRMNNRLPARTMI